MTMDDQIRACDHVPFIHDLLSDRFICLCGKTRAAVPDDWVVSQFDRARV